MEKSHESRTEGVVRPSAKFDQSSWGDFFINFSSSFPTTQAEQKVQVLKKEVKAMFTADVDLVNMLSLIDDIQRLGIDYHFEEEISEALRHIHDDHNDDDMYLAALRFRLLRQHGYNVSSDVFNKLKDSEGNFKQQLCRDAKGLLQLYEATWLSTYEDSILDDALDFARGNLVNVENMQVAAQKLSHALETPFHRGLRRLEARHYISNIYEDDNAHNSTLLELARLDFNLLQALHQAELKSITIWWKEMGLMEKLSFARDRSSECYFWILTLGFEPRYSRSRILLAKFITLLTLVDDMYDAYGTIDELQLFTDAIDRWDLQDIDHLPMYMGNFLHSFVSYINEVEEELVRSGHGNHMDFIRESFQGVTAAYFAEAKWRSKGYLPTLEEYLRVSVISGAIPVIVCFCLCLRGEVTKDTLEWVLSLSNIVKAAAIMGRLKNDIMSTQFEQERAHVSSGVQCFMNDNGVTEMEAITKLREIIDGTWKDVNKECLTLLHNDHKHAIKMIVEFARSLELIYKYEDSFTHPGRHMKDSITQLLVVPIQD